MLQARDWDWRWWVALALSALAVGALSWAGHRGPTWDDYLLLEDFKSHGTPSFNSAFSAISDNYHRPLGQWAIYAPMQWGLDFEANARLGGLLVFIASLLCALLSSNSKQGRHWILGICVLGFCASQALAEPWIWMSARFDMLMTIWGLCFACLGSKSRSPPWAVGLMAMLLALAAGLTKETAAVLVPFWTLAWCSWMWFGGSRGKAVALGVGAAMGLALWLLALRPHGEGFHVVRGLSDTVSALAQSSSRMWLSIAGLPLELAPSPQQWEGGLAWIVPSLGFLVICGWAFKEAIFERSLGGFLLALGLSHAYALCWTSALMNPATSFIYSMRGMAPGAALALAGAVGLAWGRPKMVWALALWFLVGLAPAWMQRQAWSSDMDLWSAQLRWAEPTALSTLNLSSALYDAQRFEPALAMAGLSEKLATNEASGCKAATIGAVASLGLNIAPPEWVWGWEQRSWCSVVLSTELARHLANRGECVRALAIYRRQWEKGGEASLMALGPVARRWGSDWAMLEGACGSVEGKELATRAAQGLGKKSSG